MLMCDLLDYTNSQYDGCILAACCDGLGLILLMASMLLPHMDLLINL
jgi:hypothetical protein